MQLQVPAQARPRVAAIDIMRGLVMILMTVDHASDVYNRHRFFSDGAWFPQVSPLPPVQFMTRWISHICAPTFVTLAGTALALSSEARRARGDSPASIDRHIAIRAVLLLVFEVAWMSWALLGETGVVLLQVLYALGSALLLMVPLRRLGDRALLVVGLAFAFGAEAMIALASAAGAGGTLPLALVLSGGRFFDGHLLAGYPTLPWLGMMCLGWVLGRRLVAWRRDGKDEALLASRSLVAWGAGLLAVFVVLRGIDGFGNMSLYREGPGILEWLHVSKYPPSATYIGLELGLAALVLAVLFRLRSIPRALAPVHLVGQTALFYYLLHVHLLSLPAWALGLRHELGVASAYVGAALVLAVLYPACVWYRGYKAAHRGGWPQWI